MRADTGGDVEYFFDFHTMGSPHYIDLWPYPGQINSPFVLALKELEPELQTTQEWEQVGSAQTWAKSPSGLNADYSYSPEFGSLNGELQDFYYSVGRNYALALSEVIVPGIPGDVQGDGVVDDSDLSYLLAYWGHVGVTWSEGNFNNDDIVDDADLSILLSNWGAGVDPPPIGTVPEPATAFLLTIGVATLFRRRQNRRGTC